VERHVHERHGFLTAQLNYVRYAFAAPFAYPFQATIWPQKLDWYWCAASKCLAERIDSGASVLQRYAQFFLPLLEQDRNVTRMAARALWIATVSKDGNSKAMAIDVWNELAATDRCDVEMLVAAWNDVFAGGWMKLNRVAEVFAEVGTSGPLAAWTAARLFAAFLPMHDPLPRDAAKLIELLDEFQERLGLAVEGPLRDVLGAIGSGKAKRAAKSLLSRTDHVTPERTAALQQAIEARLARAERNAPLEVASAR